MMQPVIEDQYVAARVYFGSVLGLIFLESLQHLPQYLLATFQKRRPSSNPSSLHSAFRTQLHKLLILPSPLPRLTTHTLPDLLRLIIFTGLNILFCITPLRYTTDYKLYGHLCISSASLTLILAPRTNLLSILFRIPTTTVSTYHRWLGRTTVFYATAHFALNTHHNIQTQQLDVVFQNYRIIIGIMAWIALSLIFITSLSLIRRRAFELFYFTHFIFLAFVAGGCIHASHGKAFLLPPLGLWIIDRAIRFAQNFRKLKVVGVDVMEGGVTKFSIEGVKIREPRMMVWAMIPSASIIQWHPFTAASTVGDQRLVIAVRSMGSYTKKLAKVADQYPVPVAGEMDTGPSESRPMKIRIDGPYGVSGTIWGRNPVTVLVAGGIGITPGISIAGSIIRLATSTLAMGSVQEVQDTVPAWHIHLLWIVKERAHISWFQTELVSMLAAAKSCPQVTFTITIHVSSDSDPLESISSTESQSKEVILKSEKQSESQRLNDIRLGRPNIEAWFEDVKAQRRGLDADVNACGPQSLISAARKAAAKSSSKDGLFYFEEEIFRF